MLTSETPRTRPVNARAEDARPDRVDSADAVILVANGADADAAADEIADALVAKVADVAADAGVDSKAFAVAVNAEADVAAP